MDIKEIEKEVRKMLEEGYGYQSAGMSSMGGEEEELEEGFLDKAKKYATTAALGGALALGLGGSAKASELSPAAKQTANVAQSIFKDKAKRKAFKEYLEKHEEDKVGAAMKFIVYYGGAAGKTAVEAAASLSEDQFLKAINVGLAGLEVPSDKVDSGKESTSTRKIEDMGNGQYKVYGYSTPELAAASLLSKAGGKTPIRTKSGKDEGGEYHMFQLKESNVSRRKNRIQEGEYDEVMGEAEGDTFIPPSRTGLYKTGQAIKRGLKKIGIGDGDDEQQWWMEKYGGGWGAPLPPPVNPYGEDLKKLIAILALAGAGYGANKVVSSALETSPEELQQIAYSYAENNSDKFENHTPEEIAKAILNLPEWAKDLEGDELDTEISRQLGDLEPLPYGEEGYGEEEPVIRESKLYVSAKTIDRMIKEELRKLK